MLYEADGQILWGREMRSVFDSMVMAIVAKATNHPVRLMLGQDVDMAIMRGADTALALVTL